MNTGSRDTKWQTSHAASRQFVFTTQIYGNTNAVFDFAGTRSAYFPNKNAGIAAAWAEPFWDSNVDNRLCPV